MNRILIDAAIAADSSSSFWSDGNINSKILLLALILVMSIVLIAVLVVLRAFRVVLQVTLPEVVEEEKKQKVLKKELSKTKRKAFWNKLMGLRPIEEEKDQIMDHAYDGIEELDNPTPAWFMGLFYGTILFGVVYLSVYHVFGIGASQDQEYAHEMAVAEKERQLFLASQANNVDENNVEQDKSPETIAAGAAAFQTNCAVCHGDKGQGGIGPNLTDDYWLHGGDVKAIFKTIKYGVPDKGMVPWQSQLSPLQIAQVSNFILSLRGTKPPGAKEPQGELVMPETNSPEEPADEATIKEAEEKAI
ncbi:cbb3-type cytochrome c oxidase N-terminal domain-containing protein [Olivibacter sitiensis]|uniref:cbb3-type cytochrome c oxidase N-terminal domain-containing protein n=1 Tax=Olivibacter sitiensis TaxID=376470 RepID=UPI000428472A|nr:cbb3-type cytochrome c oxidase N-terminal domain-containing protein [Olivibacter sitiensis]